MEVRFLPAVPINNFMNKYKNFIGIIDDDFLSQQEVDDIKKKVFNNKHLWKFEGSTGFFPYGLYSKRSEEYLRTVREFENILETNFSDVYNKIQKKVSDIFNVSCNFVNHKNKPGFHIFGPGPLNYTTVNYHTDVFKDVWGDIYSFIIPISLPNVITGLEYIDPNKLSNSSKILFYKKTGVLGMWDSSIVHCIKPFVLAEEEYRITIQFHVAINRICPNKSIIFW